MINRNILFDTEFLRPHSLSTESPLSSIFPRIASSPDSGTLDTQWEVASVVCSDRDQLSERDNDRMAP